MAKLEAFGFKAWALASAAFVASALPAAAQEATQQFNIPPQSLASALNEFGRQSGRDILFATEVAAGKQSPGVQGVYTSEAALRALLAGTGLEYRASGNRTFLVQASGLSPTQLGAADAASSADEEIVVTGTRLRGVETASPSSRIEREEMQRQGNSSLQDFFASQPNNLNELSAASSFSTGTSRIATENVQGVSGISLHGLGPEATLTLLNGFRVPGSVGGRIADISVIPLSVIDRVEVVQGGNSAIYGADAVAGVVNIVTRSDFDGAETQARYATTESGRQQFQTSQIFGRSAERGGFVLAFDYQHQTPFDVTKTDIAGPSTISGYTPVTLQVDGEREVRSGYLSANLHVSDRVELVAHGLYSNSDNRFQLAVELPGVFDFSQQFSALMETYSVDIGANIDLGADWEASLTAGTGGVNSEEPYCFATPIGSALQCFGTPHNDSKQTSLAAVLRGEMPAFVGVTPRIAVGLEHRDEEYFGVIDDGAAGVENTGDRTVDSAFFEINLPFVEDGRPGLHRLEATLAGRYDDYSDFGSTFNPQFGLIWAPSADVTFRGTYARSYRAPPLFTLGTAQLAEIAELPDPSSPSGFSTVFSTTGGNPALEAEEATTTTLGVDFDTHIFGSTRFSMSIFNVDFEGRIDEPADLLDILSNPDVYASVVNRSPTEAELQALLASASGFTNLTPTSFDPAVDPVLGTFPGILVVDRRRQNIAVETLSALDFSFDSRVAAGNHDYVFGARGTHYLDFERQITSDAPAIEQVNRPGRPADFRLRGYAGIEGDNWSATLYGNYVDGYEDQLATPARSVSSWTTLDFSLAYEPAGALEGVRLVFAVQNLGDEDPPAFASNVFGLGYDPANANPYGRIVSLLLSKRW